MTDRDEMLAVLRAYPQIYLACHVEHRSRAASPTGLTSRDAGLLAHIDAGGSSPARLARHLGIAPSSLSAALARLEALNMVAIAADPKDARRRLVSLAPAGEEALVASSVLDPGRLGAIMTAMDAGERAKAVEGLTLLAAAARQFRERKG